MDNLESRIWKAVESIIMIDTHEHLYSEDERNEAALDFGYLFPHYASSDLVSAGMMVTLMEGIRSCARPVVSKRLKRIGWIRKLPPLDDLPGRELSLKEKWDSFAPYWERTKYTGYGTCLRIAIRDIFNVPDLNEDTYTELSNKIANSRCQGWYRELAILFESSV